MSTLPASCPSTCADTWVDKHASQLRRGMQWPRIRKRLSGRRNKKLRSGGGKVITWSRTRSSVNFWKVRLTNPFHLRLSLISPDSIVEEKEAEIPDIDDTDGLDVEAEFEAWRIRELARIKRDKEAEAQREIEREEIERRRALPEEQRLKEDLENAKRTRDEKPKGQQKFLQKYWHKGAFHQVRRCSPFFHTGATAYAPTCVGCGRLEEARFHGSHGIYHGCLGAPSGHASQELRKAWSHQVHPSNGPRHDRWHRWVWWGQGVA